jgi:aryl-alcohol dehydrogenase-like predicted oxidoreductase
LVERAIETNYLPMCNEYGLAVVPWSPLAQGFLTGKYARGTEPPRDARGAGSARFAERYLTEENFEALDVVKSVADEVSASPAQVSIAWLLHHGDVTAPIIGARTIEQLDEDLDAVEIELTPEQFERLASVGL